MGTTGQGRNRRRHRPPFVPDEEETLNETRTEPLERHAEDDDDVALLLWLMRQLEQYDREPDGDAPLRARRRRALCAAARTVAARVDDEPG